MTKGNEKTAATARESNSLNSTLAENVLKEENQLFFYLPDSRRAVLQYNQLDSTHIKQMFMHIAHVFALCYVFHVEHEKYLQRERHNYLPFGYNLFTMLEMVEYEGRTKSGS